MALSRRSRTYVTLGVVIAFLAIAGSATFFVFNRFFQQGESTELRGRASVGSGGTASITLETDSTTRYVNDQFAVDIVLDTGNVPVSAVALGLFYNSTGTTPELEVVDADPTRTGQQLISFVSQNMPGCSEQINQVARETSGERRVFIDFGVVCSSDAGYNSNGKKIIGTILFKANRAVTTEIQHDPAKAKITRKSDGEDTLNAIPHVSYTVVADTQAPVLEWVSDSLTTGSDGKLSTTSANARFTWKGTEQPLRSEDTVLLDQYIEYQYRWNTAAWPTAWTKNLTSYDVTGIAHNTNAGWTLHVRGRDLNGNISTPISKTFTTDLTPTVSSIEPNHAAGGAQIVINGFNFGATKGTVFFGTTGVGTTNVPTWTDTRIVAVVPVNANGGVVSVQGASRPRSNTVAFNLDTTIRLVMNLQGLGQDRGPRPVDVMLSRGAYIATFSGVVATWSTTDSAYVVETPPLPDTNLVSAANYIVSVKEASRLRKRFPSITVTRGRQNAVVKKAAADVLKAGDVNGDNLIDVVDFGHMLRPGNFTGGLSNPVTDATRRYDLNGDGQLSLADISLLLSNYTALNVRGDDAR